MTSSILAIFPAVEIMRSVYKPLAGTEKVLVLRIQLDKGGTEYVVENTGSRVALGERRALISVSKSLDILAKNGYSQTLPEINEMRASGSSIPDAAREAVVAVNIHHLLCRFNAPAID
jgi:hypothetical protein